MDLAGRAAVHSALGDTNRLAIVDALLESDRTPTELARLLGVPPPLVTFHVDILRRAGLVRRSRSLGDRRRAYLRIDHDLLREVWTSRLGHVQDPVFVCTGNAARSQLAAALWRQRFDSKATSAGTEPADRVHPEAVAAAGRHGLELGGTTPVRFDHRIPLRRVITVCDRAHEILGPSTRHWSLADPATEGTAAAFDRTVAELVDRIALHAPPDTGGTT